MIGFKFGKVSAYFGRGFSVKKNDMSKKSYLDDMINGALPYVVVVGVLWWLYRRAFGDSFSEVKEKVTSMSLRWGFASEDEKDAYALQAANYIDDCTWGTVISFWRNTSDVRIFIQKNRFCLIEIAEKFKEVSSAPFWADKTLSYAINKRLNSSDFMLLYDEYYLLEEKGL